MIPPNETGLLEQTQSAVQPLTEGGEFLLSSIQYEFDHGGVAVQLCSKKMDIEFRGALRVSSDFISIFYVHSEKRSLSEIICFLQYPWESSPG
jgi:hypothetical protein